MIPTLLTCALVVVALAGCVVASMFVEEQADRRRRRRAVPSGSQPDPTVEPVDDVDAADPSASPEAAAEDPGPPETTVVLPGRVAADTAVAVLLGAYVASGGESARRAAAWVTAAAPSSLEGPLFEPGADLRGRTVAVRRLLVHDQDDRCWLTLRDGVDIARGVERHPLTCSTLDAVVALWAATRAAVSAVPHDELARVVAAIDALAPTWLPTTGAVVVGPLAEQLRTAAVGGGSARIHVRLTPIGDGDPASAATSAPEVHETV